MKKLNDYKHQQIETFRSEIYAPNKDFGIHNMAETADLFLNGISKCFNMPGLQLDGTGLTRIQIFFENAENQLSNSQKKMFADILGVVIGQVIVQDLNGFWCITENPDTEIFDLAVSFYDQANSTFFSFSYSHNYFFLGTSQLRPLDVYYQLFKKLEMPSFKICQLLKISMSDFLGLDNNTKNLILLLFSQHFQIAGRETLSHNVILVQINEFYAECFSSKTTNIVEKHKVFDASSPLLSPYLKNIRVPK